MINAMYRKHPSRKIYCADSLRWLVGKKFKAIITSLPDMSELNLPLSKYSAWLTCATEALINATDDTGCIIFYQTNRKLNGKLVDKEFLISNMFFKNGYSKVFQKIVLRKPPGSIDLYRPGFSSMFCFSKNISSGLGKADVIYTGPMVTPCAIGLNACNVAVDFVKRKVRTNLIVDPFCGAGTVLAVGNAKGFNTVGGY
jgi:hypothetical protein